jgi:outer membrane immunogenic protein
MGHFMKYRVMFATPLGLIPAAAADTANAAPPVPAPSTFWSGFYVGANLGVLSQQSKLDAFLPTSGATNYCFTNNCAFHDKQTATGVFGGLQIGYNFVDGQVLYGIEADFGLSSAKDRVRSPTVASGYTYNSETGIDGLGTVRGRLGYVFTPNTVVFGTAGLAFAKTRDAVQQIDTFTGASYSWAKANWRLGLAVGGGIEYALTRNISIKGEALYYDLGREDLVTTGNEFGTTEAAGVRDRMNGVIARIGINYYFH